MSCPRSRCRRTSGRERPVRRQRQPPQPCRGKAEAGFARAFQLQDEQQPVDQHQSFPPKRRRAENTAIRLPIEDGIDEPDDGVPRLAAQRRGDLASGAAAPTPAPPAGAATWPHPARASSTRQESGGSGRSRHDPSGTDRKLSARDGSHSSRRSMSPLVSRPARSPRASSTRCATRVGLPRYDFPTASRSVPPRHRPGAQRRTVGGLQQPAAVLLALTRRDAALPQRAAITERGGQLAPSCAARCCRTRPARRPIRRRPEGPPAPPAPPAGTDAVTADPDRMQSSRSSVTPPGTSISMPRVRTVGFVAAAAWRRSNAGFPPPRAVAWQARTRRRRKRRDAPRRARGTASPVHPLCRQTGRAVSRQAARTARWHAVPARRPAWRGRASTGLRNERQNAAAISSATAAACVPAASIARGAQSANRAATTRPAIPNPRPAPGTPAAAQPTHPETPASANTWRSSVPERPPIPAA